MINEAIILAGGLGTRLRSAVPELPKCMAPVRGKPFLHYLMGYLQAQGIARFIFSLGYKHEIIEDFLRNHYPSSTYTCSVETEPLGTGGAIRLACSRAASDTIAVVNGDTYFSVDLPEAAGFHEQKMADCTLALKPMSDSDRYGIVEIDADNRITSFKEKNRYPESLINGGVYLLNRVEFLKEKLPARFSFEKEYLETYYRTRKMFGFVQDGYFIDIGIPEDYNRAQVELENNI